MSRAFWIVWNASFLAFDVTMAVTHHGGWAIYFWVCAIIMGSFLASWLWAE